MANTKLKEKKRRQREERVKDKLSRRREALQKRSSISRRVGRVEAAYRQKEVPYRKAEDPRLQADKTRENLEHNVKVLEALQQQYIEEMKQKENLNEQLEAEGYSSIEEKLNALHMQAIELAEKYEGVEIHGDIEETKEFVQQNQETLKTRRKNLIKGSASYRFEPHVPEEAV